MGANETKIRRLLTASCLIFSLALFSSCDKISALLPKKNKSDASKEASKSQMPSVVDTVMLKNGGIIQGEIVSESPQLVEVNWQGGVVGFKRSEIADIKRGDTDIQDASGIVLPKQEDSVDENDPAIYPLVYLKNGKIQKNVTIQRKDKVFLVGEKIEGGGSVEFEFKPEEVEKVALWPPVKEEPNKFFQDVKSRYSSFHVYNKPNHVILSDDNALDLTLSLRTLEQFYNEFVMYFFEFIKPDYQPRILQAVIFGKENDFKSLLKSTGFPEKSMILGFFVNQSRILFLYNIKSSQMIDRYVNQSSQAETMVKQRLGQLNASRQSDNIEQSRFIGQGEQILDELEKRRMRVEGEARDYTMKIIRHEGAHQLLYEFGIHAAEGRQGAWLVEGLASFCEPEPIGDIHETRLMELKFELEKNQLMPLEYLITFGAGADIHKLDPMYANLAYGESWAFVHFLMSGSYRQGFLDYVRDVSAQGKDFNEQKDRELLEKRLGKPIQEIDKEFDPHVRALIKDAVDPKKYEDFRLRMIVAAT